MITKGPARDLRVILSSLQTAIAKSKNPLQVEKGSVPDFAVTSKPKMEICWEQRMLRTSLAQIRNEHFLAKAALSKLTTKSASHHFL